MVAYPIETRISSSKVTAAVKGNVFTFPTAKTYSAFFKQSTPITVKSLTAVNHIVSVVVPRSQGQLFP